MATLSALDLGTLLGVVALWIWFSVRSYLADAT
jgi:hypothetical protein